MTETRQTKRKTFAGGVTVHLRERILKPFVTSYFFSTPSFQNNNPHEWLQVDLGKVKRITGVVTQGARSLMTPMMVTEFSVTVSHDKHSWSSVLEENSQREKVHFLWSNLFF